MRTADISALLHTSPNGQNAFAHSSRSYGIVWLSILIVAALPVFWFGFVSLADAWATPEYSHGPVIPLLSAYLFLIDMRKTPKYDRISAKYWPGGVVVAIALCIAVFGNLVRIPDIVTYAFIIWIGGIVLLTMGYARGIHHWPGVLHLVFMLPLPNFLYWKLTIALQLISSKLGVMFLQIINVPVFLEGNVIDLGLYKLQVAEACSGLQYLFPIMSFSYVFGMIYNGPRWQKVVLLLAAAPITVLMNSFRIGVIGLLVDQYGIEQAEGFLHSFEGWVIFVSCIAILFLIVIGMKALQRDRRPLSETLEIDTSGFSAQFSRVRTIKVSMPLMFMAGASVILSIFWIVAPHGSNIQRVDREPFGFFPTSAGNWDATIAPLEPQVEAILGADDYLQAAFYAPSEAAPVVFFSAFYHSQTNGAGIHSPEVCLPVGGWEMFEIKTIDLDLPLSGWGKFKANRAIVQKGEQRQIVYYWFEQRGKRLTNDFNVKIVAMLDTFQTGRSDGALVRYSTPVLHGETEGDADARIHRLMQVTLGDLPRFLPP